jgi:hypothetical protein
VTKENDDGEGKKEHDLNFKIQITNILNYKQQEN